MKVNLKKYSSIDSLKNPTIGELFPRYSRIILEDLPAKFQIAKRIVADFDSTMSMRDMWILHEKLLKKQKETQIMVDKGQLNINELELPRFSLLDLKIKIAEGILKSCILCEHKCKKDRSRGDKGKCGIDGKDKMQLYSEFIHNGEEPHIVPSHNLFLRGCNMECQYCQNWEISHGMARFSKVTPVFLEKAIEKRYSEGSRNVNWVGGEPSIHLHNILKTMRISKPNLPQIWNSNFYMSKESMKLLEGVVDMYLSDFKYGNDDCARVLSKIGDYFETVSRNHKIASENSEMTVRHLVLPDHLECCTKPILEWISDNIRNKCMVNIMGQYKPEYNANKYMSLDRPVNDEEIKEAVKYAEELNLFFMT